MLYFALLYLLFIGLRFIVVLLNFLSRPYLKSNGLPAHSSFSVLIPARNESENLNRLLPLLLKQTFPAKEILIYDDDSTDNTWEVIEHFKLQNPTITGIKGTALPQGWLGKNHACYQLSKKANGDYFLFIDADVIPQPHLIERTLQRTLEEKLELLTLFPYQKTPTFGERFTVPLMHNILLSLLILPFVKNTTKPSFAAANGQFMLFKASTYKKLNPHAWVKHHAVEDINIARLYKKFHLKMETLLGNHAISCRMYKGLNESVNGFSKNMLAFFGNSWAFMSFYVLMTTFGIFSLLFMPFSLLLLGLIIVTITHLLLTITSGRKLFELLFIPFQQFMVVVVFINSIKTKITGKLLWKGRPIKH